MIKTKFYAVAFAALAACTVVSSCSSDDNDNVVVNNPVKDGGCHLDLLVSVGGTTGMSSTGVQGTYVRSVELSDIENPDYVVSFSGIGADMAEYDTEAIIKGGYYYEVAPKSNSWYGKYQVSNTGVTTVARRAFGDAVFQARKYTHAWVGDDELVVIGSNVAAGAGMLPTVEGINYIYWSRIKDHGSRLSLEDEGVLDLTTPTKKYKDGGVTSFSTSGLAKYRKSDNTIIYAFTDKAVVDGAMYIAFIDAETMAVKNVYHETRVQEMTGTAFGELQQDKMFFDEDENLYISCGTQIPGSEKNTQQYGSIIRVKKGQYEADQTWVGLNSTSNGKILTAEYIGNNKCMLYMQDPAKAGLVESNTIYTKTSWGQNNFNSFYYVYDLTTNTLTEVKYNGESLPASCGSFTDRVAVANGKAYIGTSIDEKIGASRIYVYDVSSGSVNEGAKIAAGYYFDRVSVVENK